MDLEKIREVWSDYCCLFSHQVTQNRLISVLEDEVPGGHWAINYHARTITINKTIVITV